MRRLDLIGMPIASLGHQKLRTSLTTLGVVFGAFVLAASLSIDEGVQRTIERESNKGDIVRKVSVYSGWRRVEGKSAKARELKVLGRMSPARRERIRKLLAEREQGDGPIEEVGLTRARLLALSRIPHVRRMVPIVQTGVTATLGNRPEEASLSSGAGEDPEFRKRIIFGRAFHSEDERSILLSESFAYRIGLIDDADLDQVIGKPLRVELPRREESPSFFVTPADPSKAGGGEAEREALLQLAWQLPANLDRFSLRREELEALRNAIGRKSSLATQVVIPRDFQVVGVFRPMSESETKDAWSQFPAETDLVLPRRTAVELAMGDPRRGEQGLAHAVLFVDEIKNVKAVEDQVKDLGLRGDSAHEFIERQRLTYILIFGSMTCVAGVALLVSSLGIANTMLMSVLERRREIGVMKAVGAANRQLQVLFVIEGGLIGLVGGSIGMLLAWGVSFPGDGWVRSMVQRDMNIELSESIFAFPSWIGATVVLSTVCVTMLAALYPARRASQVDPVAALRHN